MADRLTRRRESLWLRPGHSHCRRLRHSLRSQSRAREAEARPYFGSRWRMVADRALPARGDESRFSGDRPARIWHRRLEYVNQFFKDKAHDEKYLAELNRRPLPRVSRMSSS